MRWCAMRSAAEVDFGLNDLPGEELHRVLGEFRRQGPIVPTRLFGMPAQIIAGHESLAEAFRDDTRFPGHRTYEAGFEGVIGRTFISMEGRDHLRFRKLAMPAFRSQAIENYERQGLAILAHELIDRFEHRGAGDLVGEFTARFPYLVITRVLGLPREREEEFHDWALAMLGFQKDPERARRASRALTSLLAPVVRARREEPRDDVISELIHAEVNGRRLTDEEVHAHVRLLFPTGGETTHGTMGNLLFALLADARRWDRIVSDADGREAAVSEVLRWESSIAVLPRMSSTEQCEFRGEPLLPDTIVLFGIAGANRDPEVFNNPDEFSLERRAEPTLTFGPGTKSCPGMHLARKNLLVGLDVLAERLPKLRLPAESLEAALPRRTVLRSPDCLPVRWS
jgi:cytochrome P450